MAEEMRIVLRNYGKIDPLKLKNILLPAEALEKPGPYTDGFD